MILFTIAFLALIFLIIFVIVTISVGGTAFIIIFADVIACIALIVFLIRAVFKRKNSKK